MRWLTCAELDAQGDGAAATRASRPTLPPLFVLSLGLWATSAASYTLLESVTQTCSLGAAACGLIAALVGVLFLWKSQGKLLAALLLGAALGLCCGSGGAYALHAGERNIPTETEQWEFRLVEDASAGPYGSSALAQGTSQQGQRAIVVLNFDDEVGLLQGALLKAQVSLSAPSEQSRAYYWRQGCTARARVRAYEVVSENSPVGFIRTLRGRAIETLGRYGGNESGALQALACGYRNTLEESGRYQDYKTVGLAHIIAVSGAHLSIVTMTIGWALRALRLPRMLVVGLSSLFVVSYLVLAGVPISAVRAAAMVLLSFGARMLRRRSASLNAIGLCIVTFIAVDPPASVSVSLFLSAASTAGIVLFAGLISSWFDGLPRMAQTWIAEPLGLTLASNVATLPASAALFSQVSLIAPLANVAATPLFSLACVSSLIGAIGACAIPAWAGAVVSISAVLVRPLECVVAALARIPHASVAICLPVVGMIAVSVVLCAVLWLLWPRLKLRFVAVGAALLILCSHAFIVSSPWLHGDEIIMLDVGQGDAFLVRSRGVCVLIDTGNQDAKLREGLGRYGVYALDGVFISHADDDHCASLASLQGLVEVSGVYVASDALTCACSACARLRTSAEEVTSGADAMSPEDSALVGLEVGDEVIVGNFTLRVVWPHAYSDEGGNADSLCLVATLDCDQDGFDDWTALFCGDAESDQLDQMVDEGALGHVDVLKVGHHGARVALSEELLDALGPRVALISVGAYNRYGHPSDEALGFLERNDVNILRTDLQGSVRLSFSADSMSIS